MSVSAAAEAREPGLDFQFIAKVSDIFSSSAKTIADTNERVSLIATAGKYGLIFISDLEYVKVYRIASLIDGNNNVPVTTFRGKGTITHLSTSCDSQTLFICEIVNEIPFSCFYDVFHILSCSSQPVPFYETPLCTLPGSRLASLAWNPCDPCCIVAAISNGDLSSIRMKEKSMEFSSAKGIKANAVTWSSKGKQMAVGKHDGTISLFKPDLTRVRDIERPQIQEVGSVLNITWFTNTEFFVGYSINNNTTPALFYVNAPKGKVATFYTFEDVCYSSEREKPISYYSYFISEWNLLFVLSSTGIEMGVIGKSESSNANECQWCQWFPDDGARASMNFVNVVQETYPLGLAVDFTSSLNFASKDEQIIGPLPVLMSLSTGGELNIFFVENKLTEVPNLNISPESVPSHGFRTPEQYGQISSIRAPIENKPASILQLNRNASSAFSFVPKNEVKDIQGQAFSFSTPIKPLTSLMNLPALSASPVTSSLVSSAEPLKALATSFASPFVPKPVSLSSEVGVSSNFSKTLHVPSPKKSLGATFSSVALPATPASSPNVTYPAQQSPSASLKEIAPEMIAPLPKASKQQIMQLIKGELNNFEMEMLDNCNKNNSLQYKVGEKEDEQKINATLRDIKKWMSEMKKTTHQINEEVCQLHKNTFDALASYEDANSHCNIKTKSKNLMYMQLRPLDPYSHRRLNEIRSKYYYLASQITEVDSKLDLLWEEFTASKKSNIAKFVRIKPSTTDNLYRSVSNLHNSRVSFEKQLDQICLQLKKLYNNQIELSYLANNLSLNNSNIVDIDPLLSPVKCHSVGKQKASSKKISHLQKILSERNATPVRKQHISDNSKKLNYAKSLVSGLPPPNYEEKLSTAATSQSATLLNLLANSSLANAKYEDISPPISPEKTSKSSNPLDALSSLVGKVSQPKDQRLSGFSFTDGTTASKGTSLIVDDYFSKAVSGGTFIASASNQSINKSLVVPESPKATGFGLFSLSSLPASSSSPLTSMFKTNQANVPSNTGSIKFSLAQNLHDNEVLTNSCIPSSVQQISSISSTPSTSSNTLFPNMFKNISSNFSLSTKSEEGFKPGKSTEISSFMESFPENKTQTGGLFNADKVPTSSIIDSTTVFSKPTLFDISKNNGCSPFSSKDFTDKGSSKHDKDSFSAAIFGIPSTTSSSSIFNQSLSTSVSATIGQQTPSIDKNNSSTSPKAPTISSLAKLLLPQEANASSASEVVSSSSSPGVADLSNSASSPFGMPFSTCTSSIFGLQASAPLNMSATTSFDQSSSISSSAFGQLPSTLFSQPPVTTVSSLFSKPILSSDTGPISKISSTMPLFGQDSSSSTLFKQTSIFGQKTLPVGSTSIFGGGISTTSKDDYTNDYSKSLTQDAVVKTLNSSEQSTDSSNTPILELIPTTFSEQSVLPNFSSLLKPVTTTSSIFSHTSSTTSVFGIPSETSNTFGQDPSLFASTVSTISSAAIASPSSIFGAPSTSSASIFEGNNLKSVTNASIFGIAPKPQSIFGAPSTTTASAFEGNNLKSVTNASIFGSAPKPQSIFGNAGNNAPNSVLPASSTSNAFSSASVFGQTLPAATVAPSPIFETSSNTGSIFGAKPESHSSIFGSSSQNSASIFGASGLPSTVTVTSTQQSIFSSGFGQQSSSTNVFGGGSMFSGLGKAPSEENATKNVFGNLSGSSGSVPQTNIFGANGGTSSTFGSLANTSSSNAPGGMGAFSPVKTGSSIFGGTPTFGGSPSFGTDLSKPQTNMFGGTPSFGSPPVFGSTSPGGSIFGGNSAFGGGSAFGNTGSNPTAGSSTFGGAPAFGTGSPNSGFSSFANAGGATFGSLAGNQASSNSNVSTFGGSSFSGWR